jgi:hypothetical protein
MSFGNLPLITRELIDIETVLQTKLDGQLPLARTSFPHLALAIDSGTNGSAVGVLAVKVVENGATRK